MDLKGRHIVLGVTGSIAAYKAVYLLRLLKKAGAEVQVILTKGGSEFVSPLTFSTLSEREVVLTYSSPEGHWFNHVEMGLWADLVLIAPATAHTLSQLAHGEADEALLGTVLSARCPVWVAPAMDLDMYSHPATQENLSLLQQRGVHVIEPAEGSLASGLSGKGRLAEPEDILEEVEKFFSRKDRFAGKKVLVTAGPTQEAIDPVRYISNHSSGKMGVAMVQSLLQQGAEVHLVAGPLKASPPIHQRLQVNPVLSAQEMHAAVMDKASAMDAFILSAAVSDFRPAEVAQEKIKKGADEEMQLRLVRNPDIAASLGQSKTAQQKLIGFALETENAQANAVKKLKTKNLDLIVLNNMRAPGAGFGHDTNQVHIIGPEGVILESPLLPKTAIADLIIDQLHALL